MLTNDSHTHCIHCIASSVIIGGIIFVAEITFIFLFTLIFITPAVEYRTVLVWIFGTRNILHNLFIVDVFATHSLHNRKFLHTRFCLSIIDTSCSQESLSRRIRCVLSMQTVTSCHRLRITLVLCRTYTLKPTYYVRKIKDIIISMREIDSDITFSRSL